MTCIKKVVSGFLETLLFFSVCRIDHCHTCRGLKFDCFSSCNLCHLRNVNDLILGNFVKWTRFASQKLKRVCELMHSLAIRKEFIESQHLVKFIYELVFLSFPDKLVSFRAAKFESAFCSEGVFWSVQKAKLGFIKSFGRQEVDFQRLNEAIDNKRPN